MTESIKRNEELYIRPARPEDGPAMGRIAFLVGDSGRSAEGKMNYGDLPGLVYVLPFVTPMDGDGGRVPKGTTGFVLVDRRRKDGGVGGGTNANAGEREEDYEEVIAGFSIVAADSLAYREATEKYWWPELRARFPLDDGRGGSEREEGTASRYTPLDYHFVDRIHRPRMPAPECLAFSPAHMHINILPAYQRRGWGRKLVAAVVEHCRTKENLDGVFLGYMPDNENAAQFYHHVGFRHEYVEGAPLQYVGLKFEEFVQP